MAYKFLVYVDSAGRASLCEGGVYCDDSAILASAEDYRGHNFAKAEEDRAALREGAGINDWQSVSGASGRDPYELRDSSDDIDATDSVVLESLVAWQLAAILEGAEELGRLSNASAVYRERGRRAIAEAPCGFLLLDVTGAIHDAAGDARTAQFLATENSAVWHKAEGERPYQLDAIRLQALADMESGRAIMGRSSDIPEELRRLADAIGAAVSPSDSGDIPDSLAQELGRLARSRPSLARIRAAFDIGTAREELSGSPFASARNMATNAALAFGGQGDPEAPICRFVDSAIRLHREAIAAKAEARNATESLHGANMTAQGNAARIGELEERNAAQETTIRTLLGARDHIAAACDPGANLADAAWLPVAQFREHMQWAACAINNGAGAAGHLNAARDCVAAMAEEHAALESELAEAREALADWKRKADMAEADCELARRQRNAELAAHNGLSAFIGELAPVLAALPLAVLASDATEGGKLANLYLRAELLADETTGERAARYRKES